MTYRNFLVAVLLLAGMGTAVADSTAASYTPGVHYEKLSSPQPTADPASVEVRELFWYGCPHCFDLETQVEEWLKHKPEGASFQRQPAIPSKNWALFAQVYYTAETLGVLDRIHPAFFRAIHKEKRKFRKEADIATFFKEQGVNRKDFEGAWKSFAVNTKLNRSIQLTRRYGITSVPTMIVNGKYKTNARLAGSHEEMFKVIDFLIEKERESAAKITTTSN